MLQYGIHGANADPFDNVHIGSKQNKLFATPTPNRVLFQNEEQYY